LVEVEFRIAVGIVAAPRKNEVLLSVCTCELLEVGGKIGSLLVCIERGDFSFTLEGIIIDVVGVDPEAFRKAIAIWKHRHQNLITARIFLGKWPHNVIKAPCLFSHGFFFLVDLTNE
jgi:hypothetical protein